MTMVINDTSSSISASTTSARAAYVDIATGGTSFVRVLNATSAVAFLNSGDSTVTATTTNTFLNAGKETIFQKNPKDTHLAAILSTGTGTVYFMDVYADQLQGF